MRWTYILFFVALLGAAIAEDTKMTKAERKAARIERRQNRKMNKACKYDKKAARQNACENRVADLIADISEATCAATIPFPCKCKYRRPKECTDLVKGTAIVSLKNSKREPNCPATTEVPCRAGRRKEGKRGKKDKKGKKARRRKKKQGRGNGKQINRE